MHAGRYFLGPLTLMLVAGPAQADRHSAHVTVGASAGYTDNILSAPDEPTDPADPGPQADFFYDLNPGAVLVYERPTQVHQLSYGLSARLFQENSDANSFTHRTAWRAVFNLDPRTTLDTSASADFGQVNTFSTQGVNDQGLITTTPGGSSRFTAFEARETVTRSLSHELRGTQTGWVNRAETFVDESAASTAGYQIGNSLAVDRVWKRDAVAGTLGVTYADLRREQADGSFVSDDQLGLSLRATWRRDLGPRWTGNVYGGAAALLDPSGDSDLVLQPEGGVSLNYAPLWGHLSATYSRALTVNLLVAQNNINDSATLNGWLPLPWISQDPAQPQFSISGTVGVLASRVIDLEADETSSSNIALVTDLAFSYSPTAAWAVSLRYRYFRQEQDASATMAFAGYTANTVLLTVGGRYPSMLAAQVPTRATLRVDSGDAVGQTDASAGQDQ